jgi:GT2 family glycosyltransferase
LENPRKLSSAGRNIGVRTATGKYVLFLDGHCAVPRNDYLVCMVRLFESTGAACLCRPQPLNRLALGKWERTISDARHSWLGHNIGSDIFGGPPSFTDPHSAGAAYLREQITRLGGYDERFDACEDVEFNHRVAAAGLPSYRHPDLTVDYRPRSSLKSLFQQMTRYGRGRARLMARHPRLFPWPLVVITGLLVLALVALGLRGPKAAGLVAGVPLACWIALILAESVRLGGVGSRGGRIALAFLVIHAGLAIGFWRGIPEFRRFRLRLPSNPTGPQL